ncbi:MAG: SDR family oxidoreductase [Planctomycetes bacterium]|nr:SDR family oxidoreductase [Planctomycetota bacterium]
MAGETVLVLGGSGFLGAHVVERLGARGVGAARTPGPATARHVAWDALAARATERLLDELAPRAVVCCATLSRGDACERDPERAHALNVELPGLVAAHCARSGARLVHVSTDLVFGDAEPPAAGFAEEHATAPLGVYARTKLAGEERVLRACPTALVVRLPLLFGDSRGRGLGASDGLVAALAAGRDAALFVDEFRTPLDVVEAAGALVELVDGAALGRLHVAGPQRLSRYELGTLALGAAGWDAAARGWPRAVESAELELVPPRPRDAALDATRARALLAAPLSTPARALALRPPSLTP